MTSISRRNFLQLVGSSPLVAATTSYGLSVAEDFDWADSMTKELTDLIVSPNEALNIFDFSRVAKKNLPLAHYGHMASGSDGGYILAENRRAFERVFLRAKRLIDVSRIETKLELFGQSLDSPILLAPAGGQKMFHPDGELAVARAAGVMNHMQVLSNVTSTSIEKVSEARGSPVWFQLYPTSSWSVAKQMLQRAETSGSTVVMLTVDVNASVGNRELARRYAAKDTRDCSVCHSHSLAHWVERRPMYADAGVRESFNDLDEFYSALSTPSMTWDYIDRLKDATSMKVVVKGVVRGDDAERCIEHGADGVVVSNHGGNAEASGWAALDSLPAVVEAVDGRIPIIFDSGIRRGTDVFKALAMGANAVMIGRAYLWGLAAFGQPGVERVLELLRAELSLTMSQMGTPKLENIGLDSIGRRRIDY